MERIIIRRFILGGKGNVGSLHCVVVEIDATERLLDAAQRSGSFARLQLAFPHLDHVPAHTPQLHPIPGIARLIALNLLLPEAGICLRQAEIAAPLMPMPETSVYENHRTVAAKHNVGRARQSAHVLAIAESPGKQVVAHHRFRTRVAAADVRHAAMPLLGCHCVNHTNLSSTLFRAFFVHFLLMQANHLTYTQADFYTLSLGDLAMFYLAIWPCFTWRFGHVSDNITFCFSTPMQYPQQCP